MFVRPKKSLGQHFLKDKNIAEKIADSILGEPELVLEIGPGMGVLTQFLFKKYENFYAIEIDKESVEYLKTSLLLPDDKIISGDFLKFDLKKHFPGKYTIIGNFPYNISSQIFFKILENKQNITQTVCMIQKEVAERISSPPGNKTFGILSVLLQAFYDIKYLFTVNENVFIPPPKVKSAVIRLTRNNTNKLDCDENLFFRVVKTAFNQRRKTLRNSLRQMYSPETLLLEIFNKRPEQLGVQEFVFLTKLALFKEKN
jgi:16S rRNA (adenine1518-N6/adenine1519-N6)-dimethyltransferase